MVYLDYNSISEESLVCLHFEVLDKKVSYPCKDHPAACGWGRKDTIESNLGVVHTIYTCVYPYCWWGGHFFEGYIDKMEGELV